MSDEKRNSEQAETTGSTETKTASKPKKQTKKTAPKKPAAAAIEPAQKAQKAPPPAQASAPVRSAPIQQTAATPFKSRGIELTSMSEVWTFAQTFVKSGFAPKGIDTPEAALIALQMGAELGLPPMASLQNIAVINGRPSVWGDAMLAVCRASGIFDESNFVETLSQDPETGELTATCSCRRLPDGNIVTREFSIGDAMTANLTTKSGPWQSYPKRMLQMRARSWALRDAFSDILRGIVVAEEAMDMPPVKPSRETVRAEQVDELSELATALKAKDNAVATVQVEPPPSLPAETADTRHFELTEPTE